MPLRQRVKMEEVYLQGVPLLNFGSYLSPARCLRSHDASQIKDLGRQSACGSGLKWKKCTCKEYHS